MNIERRVDRVCISLVLWSIATVVSMDPLHARAQTVTEEGGNIFVTNTHGAKQKITDLGLDCCPVVSPDKKFVAFVRKTKGVLVQTGLGNEDANEIWLVGLTGEPARMLFRGANQVEGGSRVLASGPVPGGPLAKLSHPQFSPDGKRIYFWGAQAAVSGAVGVVDLSTGNTRIVTGGGDVEVIHSGPYRGCLIVPQHRYFLGGGSYDWYWVLKADGTDLGPLGDNPSFFKSIWLKEDVSVPGADCE